MAIRGISVDRVCSEMGALGDPEKLFSVEHKKLVGGLCNRFQASEIEAENAIQRAKDYQTIIEQDGYLSFIPKR